MLAVYPEGPPLSLSAYVSALNDASLETGVEPERFVGALPAPSACSVHAVARAVPPLSLVTVLIRCSAGALSLFTIVQVAVWPVASVTALPTSEPPLQDQLPAVYPEGPPLSASVYATPAVTFFGPAPPWPEKEFGSLPAPVADRSQAVGSAVPPLSL